MAEHLAKLKEANTKKTVKAKMSDGALTRMETHMAEARKVHKEKAVEERKEKRDEIFYSGGSEKQGVDTMSNMKEHLKQLTEKSDDSSDEKISGVEQAQKQKIAAAAEHYKATETAHNKDAAVEYPEQSISMMLA